MVSTGSWWLSHVNVSLKCSVSIIKHQHKLLEILSNSKWYGTIWNVELHMVEKSSNVTTVWPSFNQSEKFKLLKSLQQKIKSFLQKNNTHQDLCPTMAWKTWATAHKARWRWGTKSWLTLVIIGLTSTLHKNLWSLKWQLKLDIHF